jgi:hypothetical protein
MSMRAASGLALVWALLLPACSADPPGPATVIPRPGAWRSVATEADRGRARKWRDAFVEALAKARRGGHGSEIEREGALLQPDSALKGAALSAGEYRCRTIKLGAQQEGMLDYVAYSSFDCRISAAEGALDFVKLTGSQRPIGRILPDTDRRMIFLGTLQLGDEQGTFSYGHDGDRDLIGLVERIGDDRWRILFPYPAFESTLDVLELVPRG